MKLLFGAMMVALTACAEPRATTGPTTTAAPATAAVAQADHVVLTGERAFAVAELTYTTAAIGVGKLVDAGLIRGTLADSVRGWNAGARRALVLGKGAADAAEKARAAAELFGFADRLDAIREGR